MTEFEQKLTRIYKYLAHHKMGGMIIGRRDNFAWLTGGEESGVIRNSEIGFLYLVITEKKRYVVALRADTDRAVCEQLCGLGFEVCALNWKDISKEECAVRLMEGRNAVSDMPISGAVCDLQGIYQLHYPMTETELKRYKELGVICEEILYHTSIQIKQGMTEIDIQKILLTKCAEQNVEVDVLLIGSDERISKFRHCVPTEKKVNQVVLISPAFRKWGLHANLARMVCIGEVLKEVRQNYDAVCRIQAEIVAASKSEVLFHEIFTMQERLYHEMGYETDWMRHMHGAPTGYMLSDGDVLFSKERKMSINQAYEWYVTVTGAKSAELIVNIEDKIHIYSRTGIWPVKKYITKKEMVVSLPDIMVLPQS